MSEERIGELVDQVYSIPEGPERVAIWEEVVRLIDSLADDQRSYEARLALVDAANWAGMHDRALVAFSWCLSHKDLTQQHDAHDLLWKFKWILQNITQFAGVAAEQIVAMEDDMAKRLASVGYSPRPIEYIRCINRIRMGDFEAAQRDFLRWQSAPRDAMADCSACEKDNQVEYLAELGNNEEAVRVGEPLITAQHPLCKEVPHFTHGHIVRPLLRLGRHDLAQPNFEAAMKRIRGKAKFLQGMAEQILFLLKVNDLTAVVKILDKHLALVATSVDDRGRCRFYRATALACEKLAEETTKPLKLRVPESFDCHQSNHQYDAQELANWFHAEADQLTAAFDARNGNKSYQKAAEESRILAGV